MYLKPLYEEETFWGQLYNRMESMEFLLAWVEPGFRNDKTEELLQLDGIFIRPPDSG